MLQKYEVFINRHCLTFTNNQSVNISNTFQYGGGFDWQPIFLMFEQNDPLDITVIAIDLESCWRHFRSQFLEIRAAGGLVVNKDNLLFIFRNGKWDLPKGKMEAKEEVEETAVREVQEECSMTNLELVKKLIHTYHIYKLKGSWVFKQTDWFLMKSSQETGFVPQVEEGIEIVKWIAPNELQECLENSYETISRVVQSYLLSIDIASGKN